MSEQADILTITDIKLLVDTFYTRIQQDELLGPIFADRIQNRWPEHLDRMYRFWQTVLLEEFTYNGRPFPPHAQLPVGAEHFKQWLTLFTKTVDELFTGDKATEAKWRAGKMADMFKHKIAYIKNNPFNFQ
ncbi:group III truncated hemoglobin [Mucilaginibacter pallidiroseus]|uniref:Group III truncated hemoglobin n=1 Tax=Mucilaginibacter pallidiroseus TaxID=2599295 RepID=A0A563UC81_9SPHI|nr:group III truncated hemoglobin [Mucilaginibacter pallidiroseus]TWR28975.1 group III truncated hemoglobin [Mucilaginibacter pallidiroseus]